MRVGIMIATQGLPQTTALLPRVGLRAMKPVRTKRTKLAQNTFVRAHNSPRTKTPEGVFCAEGVGHVRSPQCTKSNSVHQHPVVAFASHVLRDITETPQLAIGPLVWGINPGADTRHWYFVVASAGPQNQLRLDSCKINFDNQDAANQLRSALFAELLSRPAAPVVVDFDDELAMAHWCEAVCPGTRSHNLRAAIQRERNA